MLVLFQSAQDAGADEAECFEIVLLDVVLHDVDAGSCVLPLLLFIDRECAQAFDVGEIADILGGADRAEHEHVRSCYQHSQYKAHHCAFEGIGAYGNGPAAVIRYAAVIHDFHAGAADDVLGDLGIVLDDGEKLLVGGIGIAGGYADGEQVGAFNVGDLDGTRQ